MSRSSRKESQQRATSPVAVTRRATKRNQPVRWSSRIADAYTTLITISFIGVLVSSTLAAFRDQLASETVIYTVTEPGYRTVSSASGLATLYFLAGLTALMLIGRTGPVGLHGPAGFWWLNLPLKRSSMLALPALKSLAIIVAIFELLYLPAIFLLSDNPTLNNIILSATCVALLASFVSMLALLAQITSLKDQLDKACGWLILGTSISLLINAVMNAHGTKFLLLDNFFIFAPPNWPLLAVAGDIWPLVVSLLLVAIFTPLIFMFDRIRRAELIGSGSKASHVGASIFLMDMRQLSYAFASNSVHGRGLSLRRLAKGSQSSVVVAHLEYFIRSRGKLATIATLAIIPGVVPVVDGVNSSLTSGMLLIFVGAAIALIASYPMQLMTEVPSLGRLLPFSAASLRRLSAFASTAIITLWALAVVLILFWLNVAEFAIPLILLSVPGLVGCSLAAAYSANDDELTGITLGMFGAFLLAIASMTPVLISFLAGTFIPSLIFIQILSSGIALWWGLRVPNQRITATDLGIFD